MEIEHNIMIKITFPDGSVREYEAGVNGLQIAESISQRLAQDVIACGVNGETSGTMLKASMPSGTPALTSWLKPSRSCILVPSSE